MTTLIQFFAQFILFLYDVLGNNLGLAIIAFTIIIRGLLLPLTLPSIQSSKKIRELQPKLKKLKEQYKNDQQGYALAQAQFYRSYNINPLAGCLPQLLQFVILIILYQTIISLFSGSHGDLDFSFLWLDLSKADHYYIAPVLAGITQFLLSIMLSPATQTRDIVPNQSKNLATQAANKKEEDVAEMAASMQQQMIFMMPLMTVFIGLRLPSGLALYWIIGTLFSIVMQYFVSGWGGFAVYWNRFASKIPSLHKYQLQDVKNPDIDLKSQTKIVKNKSLFPSKETKSTDMAAALLALGGNSQTSPKALKNTQEVKSKNTKHLREKAKLARKQKKQRKK
jgi:YidC/Oxa1 family membrane protein insertase